MALDVEYYWARSVRKIWHQTIVVDILCWLLHFYIVQDSIENLGNNIEIFEKASSDL